MIFMQNVGSEQKAVRVPYIRSTTHDHPRSRKEQKGDLAG